MSSCLCNFMPWITFFDNDRWLLPNLIRVLLWHVFTHGRQWLVSSDGFSAFVLQCFHLFDVVRAQIYLGPKKRMSLKFHWFVFKRLFWTVTISTFYLKMVLINHILPTLTHIRLSKRKVKKVHTPASFKRPLLLSY